MKGYSRHNSLLIGRKNQVKFEHDRVSRQPNSMILVSFSIAEDALFNNDVKNYDTFRSQGIENPPSRFFGTPVIIV